jgi:hypothetical protein
MKNSVVLVTGDVIASLANYICDFLAGKYDVPSRLPDDLKEFKNWWNDGDGRFGEYLYYDMCEMNARSCEVYYGHRLEEHGEYDHKANFEWLHQFVKSLNFFLYQCSEGDIPATDELYKALQTVKRYICTEFIENSDEYDEAKWG